MTSPRSEERTERRRSRQFSDVTAVLLAVATWLGATLPASRPVVALVAIGVASVFFRRPILVIVVCALLAQGLAQRASDGMQVSYGERVDDRLTLLTDPRPDALERQWRAEVAFDGRRWQLLVGADVANLAFTGALAGERVEVGGTTATLGWGSDWLRARHVVGTIQVDLLGGVSDGSAVHRLANEIRRRLTDGAESLGGQRQALFVGFVLGDDRFQDPVDAASFRRAGLTHLLAVSGQNVAFVLALLGPALGRLRLGGRLALTLTVIAMFALVTRFEPSVLRASVMASIAAVAVTLGREASSIRVLALTVSGLLLIDPFLVASVGFRLSVAASAGILVLAGPIARRIPGPRPVALAVGVTSGAQLGVAPLLLATFGPVPVASVPANLLAGPASGPVMMWGMSAGLVAGWFPALGNAIHHPTAFLLSWIELVAQEVPDRLPGTHDARALLTIVLLVVAAIVVRRTSVIAAHVVVALAIVVALLPGGVDSPQLWDEEPVRGTRVWVGSDGSIVIAVDGRAPPESTLLALSATGVREADLVIARTDHRGALATASAVADDFGHGVAVVPSDLAPGVSMLEVGCLHVSLDRQDSGIAVTVGRGPGAACDGPSG